MSVGQILVAFTFRGFSVPFATALSSFVYVTTTIARSSFLESFGGFSFCMNVTEEWFLPAHFPPQGAIMKEQQPLTSSISSSWAPCSPKHLSCVSLNPHHIAGAGLWLPPFSWPVNWVLENSRSECQILPLKLVSIKANRVRFSIARMLPINCVCTCVHSSWLSQLQEKR